jgi:hypothetical protein
VSDFRETAGSKDPGLVVWAPLDRESPIPVADKIDLSLKTNAALEFEAGDAWPFAGDEVAAPMLRLGFKAGVNAKGGAKAPFKAGTVATNASAGGGVALDYYYDATGEDDLFLLAVAERFVNLSNPFDFDGVWTAFASGRLTGLVYKLNGAASVKVEVILANSLQLGRGVTAALGAGINFDLDIKGSYALSLRRDPTSRSDAPRVLATLSRQSSSEVAAGLSLGADIDISALADRVHDILQDAMAVWTDKLARLQPYLSPGTLLQKEAAGRLSNAADKIIKDDGLRAAVVRDLQGAIGVDTADTSALVGWVEASLLRAIETSGLLGAATDQAGRIVDRLAGQLPAFAETRFRETLKAAVDDAAKDLDARLKAEVAALVGVEGKAAKELGKVLKTVGEDAEAVFGGLDDALAGVRRLIARYDELFRKVLAESEDAARRKVLARLRFEETGTKDVTYQVVGTFADDSEPARRAFAALTLGDLDALTDLFGTTSIGGFELDASRSSIRRFSKRESKFGYELVLMGFGLTGGSLLSGQASALADGSGNVQVDAAGKLQKAFAGPREGREISFVDVYSLRLLRDLAGARPSVRRTLEVGVSMSHLDKSLKRKELTGFIQSLEDVHLVPVGTTSRGAAQFDTWLLRGEDSYIPADISAKLWLSESAALTLMQLGDRAERKLGDAARRRIIDAALDALVLSKAVEVDELEAAADVVRGFFRKPRERDLPDVFLDYPKEWARIEPSLTSERARARLAFFRTLHSRLDSLVAMIDEMGRAYEATPSNPLRPQDDPPKAWDEDAYRDAQARIAGHSRKWLSLNQKWVFWAASDVHPRTVALLCAMAELAGVAGQPPMTLTVTYKPAGAPPETASLA